MTKPKPYRRLPFYSFDKILSYNAVYNFIVGGRGIGKTYGAKKLAIRKSIENGEEFIYLRRYRTELRAARDTFFADIQSEFPEHEFRIASGSRAEWRIGEQPWTTLGYFVSLSTAQSQKSVAYPKVHTIIFDEFIIEKGHVRYLNDEAVAFNNFYTTVDRFNDRVRVLFLANSVSITNPYFLTFGIEPKPNQDFLKLHKGFIVAHFPDSKEFGKAVYETRFGQFIKGTEYADYSIENQFADNDETLIRPKGSNAVYVYTLKTKTGIFSVWFDAYTGLYYAQAKRPKEERLYTNAPELMGEGYMLLTYGDTLLSVLRTAFSKGRLYFDKPPTRNALIEIFKR